MESNVQCTIETPIFNPRIDEFSNFSAYIQSLEEKKISFALINPPPEFSPFTQKLPNDYRLVNVVKQSVESIGNGFNLLYAKQKPIRLEKFQTMAKGMEAEIKSESLDALENRFWETLSSNNAIMYGIDNEISLFGDKCKIWNLNKLSPRESSIHGQQLMRGINSSFLYIGAPLSMFGCHLEDGDLNSINYNHQGAPKMWYFIPQSDNKKLEKLANSLGQLKYKVAEDCGLFIRHKTLLFPPSLLRQNGINFARVVQHPGQFIISFSGGYHQGYNTGSNMAEAVNFGSPRWLKFLPNFSVCRCPSRENDRQTLAILREIAANVQIEQIEEKQEEKFECDVCGHTFGLKHNLSKHKRLQHEETKPNFVCPVCDVSCTTASNLVVHIKDIHNCDIDLQSAKKFNKPINNTTERSTSKIIRKTMSCDICGIECRGTFNLNRHMSKQHEQAPQKIGKGAKVKKPKSTSHSVKRTSVTKPQPRKSGSVQTRSHKLQSVLKKQPRTPELSKCTSAEPSVATKKSRAASKRQHSSTSITDSKCPAEQISVIDEDLSLYGSGQESFLAHMALQRSPQSKKSSKRTAVGSLQIKSTDQDLIHQSQSTPTKAGECSNTLSIKCASRELPSTTKELQASTMVNKCQSEQNPPIHEDLGHFEPEKEPSLEIMELQKSAQPKDIPVGQLQKNPSEKPLILPLEVQNITECQWLDIVLTLGPRQARRSADLYFQAKTIMLQLEEYEESQKFDSFDINNIELKFLANDVFYFPHKLVQQIAKVRCSSVYLTPSGKSIEPICGQVMRYENSSIFIRMDIPNNDVIKDSTFDVRFAHNRTSFLLQNNALFWMKNHNLFGCLINNDHFNKEKTECEMWNADYCSRGDSFHELNTEQQIAVINFLERRNGRLPYILFGPPGTGKTKTLVAAIEEILLEPQKLNHVLVCANSNNACDEIAERLLKVLPKEEILRLYAVSHSTKKINERLRDISNWEKAHTDPRFKAEHFSHIMVDESACTHETMTMVSIAGVCTSPNTVHSSIVLAGDPKQLDAVTKSKRARDLGHGTSFMENLLKMPIYKRNATTRKFNQNFITQLIQNYRNHPAILEIANDLFYESTLKACASADFVNWFVGFGDASLLPSPDFPLVFHSIKGVCQSGENFSLCNLQEVNLVVEYIKKLLSTQQCTHKITQLDIGVVSPYKSQCEKISSRCQEMSLEDITIGSAEVFQGQEKPVMIVSTVCVGKLTDFVSNDRRMNVMLTRAKCLLVIIGHHPTLEDDPSWARQIQYCRNNESLISGLVPFFNI